MTIESPIHWAIIGEDPWPPVCQSIRASSAEAAVALYHEHLGDEDDDVTAFPWNEYEDDLRERHVLAPIRARLKAAGVMDRELRVVEEDVDLQRDGEDVGAFTQLEGGVYVPAGGVAQFHAFAASDVNTLLQVIDALLEERRASNP